MHYLVCQRTSINHSHWRVLLGLKSLSWFVMDYNLNQNVGVDGQEQQPGQPDPHEGVAAFELQEVGRAEPGPLRGGRHIGRWLLWICSKHSWNASFFFYRYGISRERSLKLPVQQTRAAAAKPPVWVTDAGGGWPAAGDTDTTGSTGTQRTRMA